MEIEKSCGCIIIKDDKVLLICARDDDGKLFKQISLSLGYLAFYVVWLFLAF